MPAVENNLLKGISAIAFILFHFISFAQINCENDTTFLIPIVDLQTGTYLGKQGGLYPDGDNIMPASHFNAGVEIAENILPINFAGDADTVVGKLVMLGLGSFDAGKSLNRFLTNYNSNGFTDTCFKIINGCIENYGLNDMVGSAADDLFWSDISERLQDENVKKKQVQVVWIMNTSFTDTLEEFNAHIDTLHNLYVKVIEKLKQEFVNLKLLYISGLHYGGYISPDSAFAAILNEPGPYSNDFAIKSVIESQINGDTLLSYADSTAPWICWGPNLWADGRIEREYDNLRWVCPGDFDTGEEGYTLDGDGQEKIASALMDFFTTDATSAPWIFGLNYPCYTDTTTDAEEVNYPEDEVLWIVQNPVNNTLKFTIQLDTKDKAEVDVYDFSGRKIVSGSFYKIEPGKVFTIPLKENSKGLYVLTVLIENKIYNKVFYLHSY